jgi:hypothetical protein
MGRASARRVRYLSPFPPALLLLFACGGGARDHRAGGEASAELVDWMNGFCETVSHLVRDLPSPTPAPDPTTEADRQPLLDFLEASQRTVSAAEAAIENLPEPPTAAATGLVEVYREDLDELASDLAGYTDNATRFPAGELRNIYIIGGIDVLTFAEQHAVLPGVEGTDSRGEVILSGGEVMSEYLDGHVDLTEAHENAPACSGGGTTTASGPPTTAGTREEREVALRGDVREHFADWPGGDQQVIEHVYRICAALDATNPDRFYPPENTDPATAASLAESLAGRSRTEILDSMGRILGNRVSATIAAGLGAKHICPEHAAAIEEYDPDLWELVQEMS